MPASDYMAGGQYWPQVQNVMSACSCSRLSAVSALKACRNDAAAAIASLHEMETDSIIQTAENPPPANSVPQRGGEDTVPSVAPTRTLPIVGLVAGKSQSGGRVVEQTASAQSVRASVGPATQVSRENVEAQTGSRATVSEKAGVSRHEETQPSRRAQEAPPPYEETVAQISSAPARPLPSTVQWDFRLPEVSLDKSEDEFDVEEGRSQAFSARRMISALQHGMPRSQVQRYLSLFNPTTLRERIDEYVLGYPAIFYIAAANHVGVLRDWVEAGGNINATEPFRHIPLLAFATLMSFGSGIDSTAVVVELLSLGADVATIPRLFFSPYIEDPVDRLPLSSRGDDPLDNPKTAWCVPWMEPLFAAEVNLSQRYFLEKAATARGPTDRQLQVAQTHGAMALLGISSFLIGQTSAARTVTQKLLAHMALPRSKPLVMVFAGPSGHGKTELARRMGLLLSLEIECVDCTEMKYETDLFGAKKPYIGYDVGSPLNNFLSRLSGKRSIVFLDEFEKTTPEVQNSLLVPFDEGKHVDRRSRSPVDCSQTIWIVATNAVDHMILNYCETHKEIFDVVDTIRQTQLVSDLSDKMKKQLKSELGTPLTGRITEVVPFLPFSPGEAAVVAHKYILELKNRVRQSISSSGRRLVGHILLQVRRDGAVCSYLAAEGYDRDQGARSLQAAVRSRVEDELIRAYLEENGQISELQPLVHYTVDFARNRTLSVFKTD